MVRTWIDCLLFCLWWLSGNWDRCRGRLLVLFFLAHSVLVRRNPVEVPAQQNLVQSVLQRLVCETNDSQPFSGESCQESWRSIIIKIFRSLQFNIYLNICSIYMKCMFEPGQCYIHYCVSGQEVCWINTTLSHQLRPPDWGERLG